MLYTYIMQMVADFRIPLEALPILIENKMRTKSIGICILTDM